jgi:hypothetical protein
MPSPQELIAVAAAGLASSVATPLGIFALCCGALAAALGIISSFVKTMIPLRCLAVGGNLFFLIYGALQPSIVVMLLHGTLLPFNIYRAAEMVRLTRRVRAAAATGDLSGSGSSPTCARSA